MSKRGDFELICNIKEAIKRIENYLNGLTFEKFLKDVKSQDAVVRNLEIIGEAAKGISDGLTQKYSNIPWKKLSGVRDRLIHHYFGVNLDIIWEIAKKDLSILVAEINKIKLQK
jgi:uncharacterized protein with HEPN domain